MDFQELVTSMTGKSIIAPWDAVCAINAAQLTSFCFGQFMENNGPDSVYSRLKLIVADNDPIYWAVDIALAPPAISFPPGTSGNGPQCLVTMDIISGTMVQFNELTAEIISIQPLQNGQNQLTGTVNIDKVTGNVNALGGVMINLAAGVYIPGIVGIDPDSILAVNLGAAIQAFFECNAVSYLVGTLVKDDHTPACLQPTNFDFYSQPSLDGSGDGCILLLIQTNGSGAETPGPLPYYPIPDNCQAALLISNEVIFNQLFVTGSQGESNSLNNEFSKYQVSFKGESSNGLYASVGSGGSINIGEINDPDANIFSSSADAPHQNQADVVVPVDNFTVAADGTELSVSWQQVFSQWWVQLQYARFYTGYTPESVEGTLQWKQQFSLSVGSDNGINFTRETQSAQYTASKYSWWEDFFGDFNLSGPMEDNIQSLLQDILQDFSVPAVNTFSLSNLLFPSASLITLQQAALPGDLLSVGLVNVPVQVSPSQPTPLQASETLQFSVPGSEATYYWQVGGDQPLGSIDSNGLYTAPEQVVNIGTDIIVATDKSNAQTIGYAMVTLLPSLPAGGLIASPATITLTQGQVVPLVVYSPGDFNTPIAGSQISWSTPDVGMIKTDTTGTTFYIAPDNIETAVQVNLTAAIIGNPQQTVTVTVYLQTSQNITLTLSNPSVGLNGTVTLTAGTGADTTGDLVWMIYPTGQGSVTSSGDNNSQAVYTAPAVLPANTAISIYIYSTGNFLQGIGLGFGSGTITITP